MIASIDPWLGLNRTPTRRVSTRTRRSSSMIEHLEPRQLFSAAPTVTIPTNVIGPALTGRHALNHVNAKDVQNVLPLTISSISLQNGNLVATGTLGGQTFTTGVTLGVENAAGTANTLATFATVPVLHLTLNPIHLNLLGLKVDTSAICLKIDANTGPGNLLGNLLAGVANLLNGGSPLGTVLGGLSGTDLNTLLGGLTGLLNGVLGQLTAPTSLAGVTTGAAAAPAVSILHLSLGPVNLNLLGLSVNLDNCAGGPVTVDIGAQPGPGNLLGNLLGGLAHLLDSNASQQGVLSNLANVSNQILALL